MPGVRARPGRLHDLQQRLLEVPEVLVVRQARSPADVHGVEHLAVDVELELAAAALPTRTGADPSYPGR